MSLYLIRHAHAVDAEENSKRPLSHRGHKQIRRLAAFLKSTDALDCDEVWHSPLVRARETAVELFQQLGRTPKFVRADDLDVTADPALVAARLHDRTAPLALVGHEPHLSALASLLVVGAPQPARFILKKGAVLALDHADGIWAVRWQISPGLL